MHFFRLSASWGVAGRQRWREELKFGQSSYLSQSDSCACQYCPSSFPPFSHPSPQPFQLCHVPWVSCSLSEADSDFYFTKKTQCFPPPPDVVQPLFPFATNLSTVSLHCLQIPYSRVRLPTGMIRDSLNIHSPVVVTHGGHRWTHVPSRSPPRQHVFLVLAFIV